jgi:hypothetical protein
MPGSYNPDARFIPLEGTPNESNFNFRLSPSNVHSVHDMHNARIVARVTRHITVNRREGTVTTNFPDVDGHTFFVGDAHSANFIKSYRIVVSDHTVSESQDFVYETNILRATYTDQVKGRQRNVLTPTNGNWNAGDRCGRVIDLRGIPSGTTLAIDYEINIPMCAFNILSRMRYLPSFFGDWQIHVIPTLDNMIYMWENINGTDSPLVEDYNKHSNQEWFSYGGAPTPPALQQQVQFVVQGQGYVITNLFFHTAQWNFMDSIYMGLLSDYAQMPFRFAFNQAHWTSSPFIWDQSNMAPVQQSITNVDSIFITFHMSPFDKAAPKQPFMRGVKINCEGVGSNQVYPSSGSTLNTFDNDIQHSWFLDAFNIGGNIFASPPEEFHTSMLPFKRMHGFAPDPTPGRYNMTTRNVSLKRSSISDFILAIPLAPDGTVNEGVRSETRRINWLFSKAGTESKIPAFYNAANLTEEIDNPYQRISQITFTSVCDWVCTIIATPIKEVGQASVTQGLINL